MKELIFFLPILIFIVLDYVSFILRRKDIPETKKEGATYFPNLRIWGLGIVAGIGSLPISYHAMIETNLKGEIYRAVGGFGFILLIVGFMLIAVVKIVKED